MVTHTNFSSKTNKVVDNTVDHLDRMTLKSQCMANNKLENHVETLKEFQHFLEPSLRWKRKGARSIPDKKHKIEKTTFNMI